MKRKYDFETTTALESASAFFQSAGFKTATKGKSVFVEGDDGDVMDGLFQRFMAKYFITTL